MICSPWFAPQFTDDAGNPLASGYVYTYEPGSTTAAKKTYQNYDGSTENTTPIVLDGGGRCHLWLNGLYNIVVKDSSGNTVWEQDYVGGSDTGTVHVVDTIAAMKALTSGTYDACYCLGYTAKNDGGGGLFYYDASSSDLDLGYHFKPTDITDDGRWIRVTKSFEDVNVKFFGATGDGTTDDTVAIAAADAYAYTEGLKLLFPTGTYVMNSDPTFTVDCVLEPAAYLKFVGSFTPTIDPIIDSSDRTQHFPKSGVTGIELPAGFLVLPEWFGATGDGATDDYTNIQAAVNAIGTNGGIIELNQTYIVSDSIALVDNVIVQGTGTLKCKDSTTITGGVLGQADTGVAINNVIIKGITVDGNKANTGNCYGGQLYIKTGCIRNCIFKNCSANGLQLLGTEAYTLVYANRFSDNGAYGNLDATDSYCILPNYEDEILTQRTDLVMVNNLTAQDINCTTLTAQTAQFDSLDANSWTVDTLVAQTVQADSLQITEGSNARMGVATLGVNGIVTVVNNSVTASTRIFTTIQTLAGSATPQAMYTGISPGASFQIVSADTDDRSVVAWLLVEPL